MANSQRLSREVNRKFLRVAVAAALVLAAEPAAQESNAGEASTLRSQCGARRNQALFCWR